MTAIWILLGMLAQQPATAPSALEEWNNRGRAAIAKNDLKGAEEIFRSGVNEAKSAGDRGWESEFERAIGETYQRRGQWREALPFYEASLAIRRELGQKPQIAYMLTGIGLVHSNLQQYAEAEQNLLAGRAAFLELGNRENAAQALMLLGELKIRTGRMEEAKATLNEAIALFDAIHDDNNAANARVDLAVVYRRQANYRAALETAFEALEILRRTGANQDGLQRALEGLGNVFIEIEQPEKALGYYRRCLEIRLKAGVPQPIAQAYNNIGAALEKTGQHAQAVAELSRALEIRRSSDTPAAIAQTLVNLGTPLEELGKNGDAAAAFREAVKIAEEHGDQPDVASGLYGLGNLAMASGSAAEGIALHERALKIRQDAGDRINAVFSLNRLALAHEMKGELEQAEKLHASALEEFERIAAGISDPAQVGRFRQSTVVLYPHYARVLLKEGKAEAALAIAERSRGVGLMRMAEVSRRGFKQSLSAADRTRWTAITADRARATNRLRDALGGGTPEAIDRAREDYLRADNALEQSRDQIYAANPGLAPARAEAPDAARIVEASRAEPRTLYLEWLMVESDSALLFAVSDGRVRGFELGSGAAAIGKQASAWRNTFERGVVRGVALPRITQADPEVERKAARGLYAAVFGPMAGELEGGKWSRLVLAPDGPLLDLPFAALESSTGGRLIERYPITTGVSLVSILAAPARKPAQGTMFAVGDPLEPGEQRVVAPEGNRYAPLEHARAEAKAVAALFPESRVLIGGQATEAVVKAEMGRYRMIHFATHGILSRTEGLDSGLLLANEAADQDGVLQAWEIAEEPLSADLAVLSACDTAEGDERLGEGLMGLAWAFQAAGCSNVLASLWSIDDEATQRIMIEFYGSIRAGKRVDESMRSAMVKVKESARTSSPYYWAGFRVLGPGGVVN